MLRKLSINKPSRTLRIVFCAALTAVAVACRHVPGYVIPPDEMADVMADIHMAEAVVEANFNDYHSDSVKMLLKQSVLARHGYTLADLDTSLMWYGANLNRYNDVFDTEIEILEKRLADAGTVAQEKLKVEMGGDSVDIWTASRFMFIRPNMPSQSVTYDYASDPDWEQGDMFTLRAKFTGVHGSPAWTMSADYDDGTIETVSTRFSSDGWHEMTFYADSLKKATRLYGSMTYKVDKGAMIVDSLQLIRRPLVSSQYSQRYRQRAIDYFNIKPPRKQEPDTTATNETNAQ